MTITTADKTRLISAARRSIGMGGLPRAIGSGRSSVIASGTFDHPLPEGPAAGPRTPIDQGPPQYEVGVRELLLDPVGAPGDLQERGADVGRADVVARVGPGHDEHRLAVDVADREAPVSQARS